MDDLYVVLWSICVGLVLICIVRHLNRKDTRCPRIIREIVGLWADFKVRQAKCREENVLIDWLVDKLVDRVLNEWYVLTYNTPPKSTVTIDEAKNAVRWWSFKKKTDAFFNMNLEYGRCQINDHLRAEFEAAFPDKGCGCCFYRSHHSILWIKVQRRIVDEIF